MKVLGIVISIFVLSMFVYSCNDNSNPLIDQYTTTELASTIGQVKLVSKHGDRAEVTKFITPVQWDGKEDLNSGKAYRWINKAEMFEAYKNQQPDMYEGILKLFEVMTEKRKIKQASLLAWAPNIVNAFIDIDYDYSLIWAFGEVSTPPFSNGSVRHYIAIEDGSTYIVTVSEAYYDGLEHYNAAVLLQDCPNYLGVGAICIDFVDGYSYTQDQDTGECN